MAVPEKQQKSKKSQKKEGAGISAQKILERINNISSRLRLTEERINNNRERLKVFDADLMESKKNINNDIKEIESEIRDVKKNIKRLEDNIQHIIKELELMARKQDVKVIEKYVDMMDPSRYITKEEVLKLLEKRE